MTSLVLLDEAKDTLNITSSADDAELQAFIDGITPVVAEIIGPVGVSSFDEFYDGGRGASIALRNRPVVAVTAVTEWQPDQFVLNYEPFGTSTYSNYGYRVDLSLGTVTRLYGGLPMPFWLGQGNIEVTYTAGYATIPDNVRQAALEIIRVGWQPQQSGNLPGIDLAGDMGGVTVLGYFIPNRARELLQASQRIPVVG